MAQLLFGWEIIRKKEVELEPASFTPRETDDGAVVVAPGGSFGTYVDLDGTVRTETELVSRYREMAMVPECDLAIAEIANESISTDEEHDPVSINLDELDTLPGAENVKEAIIGEFKNILKMLEFNTRAYDLYRQWYVDGRLYYHVIIDEKDVKAGIKELRYIDPRKIRKIREVAQRRILTQPGQPSNMNATVQQTQNEYYVYTEKGFNTQNRLNPTAATGLRIATDAIINVTSGLTDVNRTMVLSHLHKAIKPLNQLRTLEDAVVIYRLARAPERRVWFIDVGNLPKMKAEQYVRDIMVKHKNRLVYDSQTGEIRDDRKFMTMLEDYWLPRREGGKGTEVTTLPAGQNLGQMDDVLYFQKKLYAAMNVPVDRIDSEHSLFAGNQSSTISREELKFNKFITRLRVRFATLFLMALERQLILKGIITYDDWVKLRDLIKFNFNRDSHFTEVKDNEILMGRLQILEQIQPYVGSYFSSEWVKRNVLRQSDEDIEEMDAEMAMDDMSNMPGMGPGDPGAMEIDPATGLPIDPNQPPMPPVPPGQQVQPGQQQPIPQEAPPGEANPQDVPGQPKPSKDKPFTAKKLRKQIKGG